VNFAFSFVELFKSPLISQWQIDDKRKSPDEIHGGFLL